MDGFVLPRGLNRSGPRDVRLSAAGRVVVALAAGLLVASLLAAVLMTREASRQGRARRGFVTQSVTTDAEVVRLWQTSGDSHHYWVQYRFATPLGTSEGRARLPKFKWQTLHIGSRFAVRYVPDDPEQNYLGDAGPRTMPSWLPMLIAAALASGGVGCLWLVGRERRLLESGRVAPAVVTRHRTRHSSHGTHRSMTYEFPVLSGAKRTGKSSTSRTPPAVGSVIPVLYDAEQPARNQPYPLALVTLTMS